MSTIAHADEADVKAQDEALTDAVIGLLAETRRELREGLRTPEQVLSAVGDEEVA